MVHTDYNQFLGWKQSVDGSQVVPLAPRSYENQLTVVKLGMYSFVSMLEGEPSKVETPVDI